MNTVRIKRNLDSNVDPKQALRAHVEQLPIEKQYEFIDVAFQLMAERVDLSKVGTTTRELMS